MSTFMTDFKYWLRKMAAQIATPAPRPAPQCTNISMLLMHLVDFNQAHYAYVLRWLAYQLRNPGTKMNFGIIITGDAGTGKHLFFQRVAMALHGGHTRIMRPDTPIGVFNNWACGLRLVVIDGVITHQAISRIKGLMASRSLTINDGAGPRERPNHLNFVLISNTAIPAMPGQGPRRFFAIDAPPPRENNFYRAVKDELENGGLEAFHRYLLCGLDMSGFDEYTLPPGMDGSGNGGFKAKAAAPRTAATEAA